MDSWTLWQTKQPFATTLLINSLKKNRLAHAYLFEGSKGSGKMNVAMLLIKTLYCSQLRGTEPCHECSECRRITSKNHPDVHFISPEGSSIKIDQIRNLQKEMAYLSVESKRKTYLVEQADLMTQQAANSLLKILEEPHDKTLAILLTEHVFQVIPTILSRCLTITLNPPLINELCTSLEKENISHPTALLVTTLTTNFEQALQLATDDWFAQARNIVIQLTEDMLARRNQLLLTIQEKWVPHFKEREQVEIGLHLLLIWFRDVMNIKLNLVEDLIFIDKRSHLESFSTTFSLSKTMNQMEVVMEASKRLHANVNPQLVIEQVALKVMEK